jgi:hypothetical protein
MNEKDLLQTYGMPLTPEQEKQLYFDCKDGKAKRRARREYMRKQKHERRKVK